jgi:hypothetical protein
MAAPWRRTAYFQLYPLREIYPQYLKELSIWFDNREYLTQLTRTLRLGVSPLRMPREEKRDAAHLLPAFANPATNRHSDLSRLAVGASSLCRGFIDHFQDSALPPGQWLRALRKRDVLSPSFAVPQLRKLRNCALSQLFSFFHLTLLCAGRSYS